MKYIFLLLTIFPLPALAHVEYVLDDDTFTDHAGSDVPFLLEAVTDVGAWALILLSLLAGALVYVLASRSKIVQEEHEHINECRKHYEDYFPWMARLAIGISLIGAGSSGAFISPAFEAVSWVGDLQILLGFMVLVGFLLSPVMLAVAFLYLLALVLDPYAIGNLDLLALVVMFMMYGSTRPGADDLLEIPFVSPLKKFKAYAPFVLRVGIGVAMIYLALWEKLLNPHTAELVVQNYELTSVVPVSAAAWVFWAGFVELFIGVCLLLGVRVRTMSLIAFLVLSLSFFYFGEEVYSHITLFTVLSILFVVGPEKWKPSIK